MVLYCVGANNSVGTMFIAGIVPGILSGNQYVFLIIINILLFFVGMFFDGGPAMIILAPILAPVAVSLGIDPIHFGIIMVCNSALGQITPPFGVNLFVASRWRILRWNR